MKRTPERSAGDLDPVALVTGATGGPPDPRFYERDKLMVKFRDAFRVRLRKHRPALEPAGKFSAGLEALLAKLPAAAWWRMHSVDEQLIDEWVAVARKKGKRPPGDLNNYYIVLLESPEAFEIAAELMGADEVQFARPLLKPAPLPAPDLTSGSGQLALRQEYLRAAPLGVDADFAWTFNGGLGGDGSGVTICDIEHNWNFAHSEFTSNGGLAPVRPVPYAFLDTSHGTQTVGVYGSNRDFGTGADGQPVFDGTTGIAFGCGKLACSVFEQVGFNIAGAITAAAAASAPGDILLIELQFPGPNAGAILSGPFVGNLQRGFVPVEWDEAIYDAIATVTANGRIVVEPAGNGAEDLDDPIYRRPNPVQELLGIEPHAPFLPGSPSGAIVVGAGISRTLLGVAVRSRSTFSNYGARVDVQGWGDSVVTTVAPGQTGTADRFDGGPNSQFTSNFRGTSSASAIVAGCCASIQGVYRLLFDRLATPAEMRGFLQRSASAQGGNTAQHIGPLPDLKMALQYIDSLRPPPPWLPGDGEPLALPFTFEVEAAYGARGFGDVQTWFSFDGTDPVENASARADGPITIEEPGIVEVRARTFGTSSNGRGKSEVARRLFRLFKPGPGPRNFSASQGVFDDKVRLQWESLDIVMHGDMAFVNPFLPPSTYDVFAVTGSPDAPHFIQLNTEPITECRFDYLDDRQPPLVPMAFAVRGMSYVLLFGEGLQPRRPTRFSDFAQGWLAPAAPVLTASDGEYADHVHVEWAHYDLGNYLDLEREYTVLRGIGMNPFNAVPLAHLTRTYVRVNINGVARDLPRPAPNHYDDFSAEAGETYYYYVLAKGRNANGDEVESPRSNGDLGWVRAD